MPLYEYRCGHCGSFDVIQKFSDAPLAACPTCAGEVQKQVSAPAIQFKGSGWYITDYARKSSGTAGGKGEGSSEKTAASGDAAATPKASASSEASSSPTPSTPSKSGGGNAA